MNTKTIGLYFLVLIFAWPLTNRAQGQTAHFGPVEIASNGGFEEGTEGWTITAEVMSDPKQAHAGLRCFFGEVTQPNRVQFIKRVFRLKPMAVYRLTFWARSSNRNKVAVWIQGPDGRRNLAQLENIPARWQLQEVKFSVAQAGDYELQLAAPSSHGKAPIGKMWIDDVSLLETVLPPSLNLTQDRGFCDRPALAATQDGQVYVAWIAFEDGRDFIRVAQIQDAASEKPIVGKHWSVPVPEDGDVESVVLCGEAADAWLAASCEVKGNWEIFVCRLTASGPSPLVNVTQDLATDIKPGLALCRGLLFLTWETNRDGSRKVYAARVADSALHDVRRLSTGHGPNFNPSIAADETQAWAVWESFRDSNYDIYGARFDGNEWSSERRLTTDPRIEHRPVVALRHGQAWVAWETLTVGQFRTSHTTDQRSVVAQITPAGLAATENVFELFPNWTEMPTLAFDNMGNLWVAARTSRGKNQGWDVLVRGFDGSAWSPAQPLTAGQGRAQRAPLAVVGQRLIAAVQTDTIPARWDSAEASKTARSNIELCPLKIPPRPFGVGGPSKLTPLPRFAVAATFAPVQERAQWAEDSPRQTIEYQGQTLNLYFGQFHEHSEISPCNRRGDLPPEDNHIHNRDIHREDFSAITDHGYSINPQIWHYTGKLARIYNDPGRFITFLAEEWTSSFEKYTAEHPYGYYGHRNLIFADPHFPRWFNAFEGDTPAKVWDDLRKVKANFIHIPHQLADTGNVPVDWNFHDDVAQPVAEIFQSRQSYEYKGCPRQAKNTADGYFIQDAWAKGIVIGVIASPDHGGGQGKAAVYAPELTREAILDACRARHTYGTSGAKIFLDARVNGYLMGEKRRAPPGPVEVTARVIGASDLERVEVCRNNVFIYSCPGNGRQASFKFVDTSPLSTTAYYYVRVVQKDGELAWSSPVWLTK